MRDTGRGLERMPEGAAITAPPFIPSGDVGLVTVTGANSTLVLFDLRNRSRVALR